MFRQSNMLPYLSIWGGSDSIVTQNDTTEPIRAHGTLTYEVNGSGWALGSGNAADTFVGIIDGVSFYPNKGSYTTTVLGGVNP